MIYCFDLDGTLCHTDGLDYARARPIPDRVDAVNSLRASGHIVIIDTARGSGTGEDWTERTAEQLRSWGLSYDTLRCGRKAFADVYVDDRAISAESYPWGA